MGRPSSQPNMADQQLLGTNEKDYSSIKVHVNSASPKRRLRNVLIVEMLASIVVFITILLAVQTLGQEDPEADISKKKATLCETPECIRAAAAILERLAPIEDNVDPCDDFEKYVCAGWQATHDMTPDQSRLSEAYLMNERNTQVLQHVIEGAYPEDSSHSSYSPRSLQEEDNSIDKENFNKIKDAYDACMNEDAITKLGADPLIKLLDHVKELLPVDSEASAKDDSNGLTDAFIYANQVGVSPLMQFSIGADDKTPDTQNLTIFNPWRIGLPSKQYYKDPKIVVEYTNAVIAYMTLLRQENNITSKDEIHTKASNVIEFERQLAEISQDIEDMLDVTKTYNPMSVKSVQEILPQISFEKIFKEFSSDFIPEVILVASPSYLKGLSKILESASPATIQGYFVLKIADSYSGLISDEINKPLREFKNKLQGKEPSAKQQRWKTCVSVVDNSLGWILGRFFIEKAFSEEAKKLGDRIVYDIKDEFVHTLKKLDWISNDVRKLAIEKVGKTVQKIGYPETSPNIKSPSELQKYYKDISISNSTFFDNALSVSQYDVKQEWKALSKPTDRNEWGMTPPTVNAYNSPNLNEIVFPAGIMQQPSFNVELPGYINYGSFGAISGHELSHSFDSTGRNYDQNGYYKDWWDNTTIKNFDDRASCFVDQFSKYSVEGPDGKPLHINGNLTLGENIADAGGLNAAFGAWKKRDKKKPDQLLPGLHKRFTKEQLFFVSYGSFYCGKSRKEAAVERVYTDPHSPGFARLGGTTANSIDFLKAFKCKTKKATCEMW